MVKWEMCLTLSLETRVQAGRCTIYKAFFSFFRWGLGPSWSLAGSAPVGGNRGAAFGPLDRIGRCMLVQK